MNPETGEIRKFKTVAEMNAAGFIPILRNLTAEEKDKKQIRMYSPCGCGSGKKFKFCCHTANAVLRTVGRKG